MTTEAVTQNKELLSIEGLHVWFELRKWGFGRAGYVRAVDNVSFKLDYGEAIAFVGESGCGKSSLAKSLLALYKPTKGNVFFDGKDLHGLTGADKKWYRAQVGYVQQDPYGALPPFMNIQHILEEPLLVNNYGDAAKREARIREVLDEVRLTPVDDFLHKFPHMLSGGQQQRVVIARAMIMRPKLIIAD